MELGANQKKKVPLNKSLALELHGRGCDAAYIAERCSVTERTVQKFLKSMGLALNPKRTSGKRIKDRTPLEQDAYDAFKMGVTYGQYKALQYQRFMPKVGAHG